MRGDVLHVSARLGTRLSMRLKIAQGSYSEAAAGGGGHMNACAVAGI
jgi:hypothetical protein